VVLAEAAEARHRLAAAVAGLVDDAQQRAV
jgi:hypothetical protein